MTDETPEFDPGVADQPLESIVFEFGVPTLEFPPKLVDAAGHRVRPGSSVSIPDGRRGEVTSWRGGTRVEVILDDTDVLSVETIEASSLTVIPMIRPNPLTMGSHLRASSGPSRVTLIQPVGGQDVVSVPDITDRTLPLDSDFRSRRGQQEKVDARKFGQACLDTLAGLPVDERAAVVARELDVVLLSRALEETVLPEILHRLVLVATDQIDQPHLDDTAPFAELMSLWVRGTADVRGREVRDIEIVTLHHLPHRVDFVIEQITEPIRRFALDSDELVVVQAGGTPAMSFGVLATAMSGLDVAVRHVQVPFQQAVVELDFPRTIRMSQIAVAIEALVLAGRIDSAIELATEFGFSDAADELRNGGASSAWKLALDDRA